MDLGICALLATSTGELVCEGRYAKRATEALARTQRELSNKVRGSNRRKRAVERVARAHRLVAYQRRDLAHKLSRRLVNTFDLICCEDLEIANMTRRPRPKKDPEGGFSPSGARAKAGLNRSIHDAGWGVILAMLAYKAEDAGRQFVVVDPRHTSQRCAESGHTDGGNRQNQALFVCRACGHRDHADTNAAKNILRAGRALRDECSQELASCAGSGS